MEPADFDTELPMTQGSLFSMPDRLGTPTLFCDAFGIPAWVASQRQTRGMCARCGQAAQSEVTWADGFNHGTELLCDPCWAKGAARAAR